MMRTLLDPTARAELVQRLRRVTPESDRRWGRMTAPLMICHLADHLRVGLGEVPVREFSTPFRRTVLKWIGVDLPIPWPHGLRTAREMQSTQPTDWEGDVAAVEALIERVAMGGAAGVHPLFGTLTPRAWARLSWKHVNHHLRQFGV